MIVIGMSAAQMYYNNSPLWISNFSWKTFIIFLCITSVCSSSFILNQICDQESDTVNKKLFLVGKYIAIDKSKIISNYLFIAGNFILLIINWYAAIITFFIYLIWGILYSSSPYKWKSRPLLGWLANSIVGVLLFVLGWGLVMENNLSAPLIPFDLSMIFLLAPYALSFSSVALLTTLPDLKGDRSSGDRTFPIVFGKGLTLIISLLFIMAAFILALENLDPIASTSIIVSIPFFLFACFRRQDKDILRAIRYPIFILNFFVLSIYPLLFFPIAITFYISKYYYWHRFNLHYPAFIIEPEGDA
jgi:4-hydroxybenzoate polyprenyltransferase